MKKYTIVVVPEAVEDILSAKDWYNSQINGLGESFTTQVKFSINALKTYPLKNTIRYDNVRCSLVKKFPFLIHYSVDEIKFRVEIYAVFHTSRNPKIWEEVR